MVEYFLRYSIKNPSLILHLIFNEFLKQLLKESSVNTHPDSKNDWLKPFYIHSMFAKVFWEKWHWNAYKNSVPCFSIFISIFKSSAFQDKLAFNICLFSQLLKSNFILTSCCLKNADAWHPTLVGIFMSSVSTVLGYAWGIWHGRIQN